MRVRENWRELDGSCLVLGLRMWDERGMLVWMGVVGMVIEKMEGSVVLSSAFYVSIRYHLLLKD